MLKTIRIELYDGTISVVRNIRNMEHKYDDIMIYGQDGDLLAKLNKNDVKNLLSIEE